MTARAPSRADAAIAAGIAAYGFVEAALIGAPVAWYAAVAVLAAPLAWRRRWPLAVASVLLGAFVAIGLLGGAPDSVLPLPLILVVAFTAGRESRDPRRAAVAALALVAAVTLVTLAFDAGAENSAAEDLVALALLAGVPAALGQLLRQRQRENRHLRDLSARLEAEQAAVAAAAVLEERTRIARELHDVVAHGVSLIAVQAAAADELLDRDPERARASLRAVQDTSRSALGEMRTLLDVLRDADDEPERGPQPGLASLDDLLEQLREGGLPVELVLRGEAVALGAGLDLSAYRIVQEALTNVRRHAGAVPTRVLVDFGEDELLVEVANERPDSADRERAAGGGHGLVGLRERARLYGGTLEAGPEGARYVVRARLPLAGGAA